MFETSGNSACLKDKKIILASGISRRAKEATVVPSLSPRRTSMNRKSKVFFSRSYIA